MMGRRQIVQDTQTMGLPRRFAPRKDGGSEGYGSDRHVG